MKISTHFRLEEFDCKDGTLVPIDYVENVKALVYGVLEPVRKAWGFPIQIISGYRTCSWNTMVRGATHSYHLKAKAADIQPYDLHDVIKLYDLILELYNSHHLQGLGGLGEYKNFIHVDTVCSANGKLRMWGYP
jgi:uncharacterized protein YcbK (DUF882 family)